MVGEQKNKNDGYVNISTKVPPHIAQLFDLLAKQRGMQTYELLQLLVSGFIAAAKHDGPMTPELRLLIDSLKLDVAFVNAFNFASPTACAEIARMVLVLQQPGRKGFGLMMIDRPFMGNATTTYCTDVIVETVTEAGMGDLYEEIRKIGASLGTHSVRETLVTMCDAQKVAILDEEFAEEMPGHGEFHDFGRRVEYGKPTKRKPHRTPDSLANSQQRIVFNDYDREIARREVEGWQSTSPEDIEKSLGCKPFDVEP